MTTTRLDRAVDAAIADENRRFLADPAAIADAIADGDLYRRRLEDEGILPRLVWLAELDTAHFTFRAIGSTREQALNALGVALDRHGRERDLEPDWYDLDDPNVYEMTVDAPGTRDGLRVAP